MIRNLAAFVLLLVFLFPKEMQAQELKIFTVKDFDLKGNVKSSLVSTNYGKEEYEFNEEGFLTKSVTRYNESDYDITYYKYSDQELLEKRLENYRDGVIEKSTSMASFYFRDTLKNLKITEKIVSYTEEFLDQYEYFFISDSLFNIETLNKIIHSNDSGIDETLISYTNVKEEQTVTYTLNDVVQKSDRTSYKTENDSIISRNVLSKKFLNGKPSTAVEETFDGNNKLIARIKFYANPDTEKFTKDETTLFTYDENGMLSKKETQSEKTSETKEYIYQFDKQGNWIKEIITPDNAFKTRQIKYHEVVSDTKMENPE
jgi:hypothetical protein